METSFAANEAVRKAEARRPFDMLCEVAKGTPQETIIAKAAAEMGWAPDDPVWREAMPVLLAAGTLKNDAEAIQKAVIDAFLKTGNSAFVKGLVEQANGGQYNAQRIRFEKMHDEATQELRGEAVNSFKYVYENAQVQMAEARVEFRNHMSLRWAAIAILGIAVLLFGEGAYVHQAAYHAGYGDGAQAEYQQLNHRR